MMNSAASPGSSSAAYNKKDSDNAKSIALGSDDSDDEDIMMTMKNGNVEEFEPSLITGRRTDAEKNQSMLLALCTGLGATTYEDLKDGTRIRSIEMGEDCSACIADIQRYLRRDDSMKSIFKLLSSWDIVQTRLLPLIYKYQDNKQLQFAATKLVVMLTMPPENGFSEASQRQAKDVMDRLRGDERERKALAFLTVSHVRYLQEMKDSFLQPHILKCFVDVLADAWARDGFDRDEHDLRVIELVLSLFRNLLHVPNSPPKSSTKDAKYCNLQENFIVALEKEYIIELVLHLIQHVNEEDTKEWNLLLLEMMYLLLRGQNPATLLAAPTKEDLVKMKEERKSELAAQARHYVDMQQRSESSNGKRTMLSPPTPSINYNPNDPLLRVTAAEKKARTQRLDALGSRHSRFGGTFAVRRGGESAVKGTKNTRSIDDDASTPMTKQFVWAHNLADPHQKQRRQNGGIIRGSNGIRSMNVGRGTRLAQTCNDAAACRAGATDGSVRPNALTVGFGLGGASTVNTAAKSNEVKASLKCLMEEFLKTGYGPLMKSVKSSFVRESDRLLPADSMQMMYITTFGLQYHRLALEKKMSQPHSKVTFDVHASADQGVGVSLDLWSFRFYTKNIINYVDSKKWVELGIAVSAFKGSPSVQTWSSRLIGVVFYEREIMDLIPSLLMKCHEAKKYITTWYITDLMETAHAVLNIGEKMAERSMLVRTRKKKRKKDQKKKEQLDKKKKRWNTEQIFALEEGVRQLGIHKWDQIVRHPHYGPAMGGNREADEIMEKFEAVQKLKSEGQEIESDPEEDEDTNKSLAEQQAEKEAEEERLRKEKEEEEEEETFLEHEFHFDSYLKKFFTNTIIQVYLRILEQYKYNDLHINHCVIKLLHRLSTLRIGELGYGVDEDNEYRHAYGETILYQVAYMDLFERILEDKNIRHDKRYRDVLGFTKSIVRHFIRAIKENPLLIVEAMFWRSRRAHVSLQNGYHDSSNGSSRRQRSGRGNDDMEGNAVRAGDQEDEEEADLDVDALGKRSKRHRRKEAEEANMRATRKNKSKRWTQHEDALLASKFPALLEQSDGDKQTCFEILALEDLLSKNERDAKAVERRIAHLLKANKMSTKVGAGGRVVGILDVNVNMLNKSLSKLLLDRTLARELLKAGE
jgi:hypothetical protein